MDVLRRLAVPIPADVGTSLEAGRRYVAVTFDDGLTSFLDTAWPELERCQIPAAIFVVAGKLGTVPGWVNYSHGLMPTEAMLSVEQLRHLSPTVIVGSHSMSHRMLTDVSADESMLEIAESRCTLERLLERRINVFSFPYGERSDDLVEQCRAAGYKRVFTSQPSLAFEDPQEFETGRIHVQASDWPIEFTLKLVGAYRWLPYAFMAKRLVFRSSNRRAIES
jgi:peptidoglycan/xylan/chitin deacetylase (PgdA/CDA1 family)